MIVVLALAASAAWAFASVAETMSEGESHSIDRRIVFALRDAADPSNPIGPPWFEEIARDITGLGGIAVLGMASLAVIIYVLLRRAYQSAVVIAIAVVGAQ